MSLALARDAGNLLKSKNLVLVWAGRTVKARYQQSALGWLWAAIQPVATAVIVTIVFTRFVPVDTGNIPYLAFSYAAVVPWTFLAGSLSDMCVSLVQNMNLITKIYFPREVLPIAAMVARLMDFGIALALLLVIVVHYGLPLPVRALLYLPLILAVQLALITGIGIAAAAINVFYRDTDPVLRLVVQVWFYASPVIYAMTVVPPSIRQYYLLNPMAGIIEAYRDVLLRGTAPGGYLWLSAAVGLMVLAGGYWLFKHLESRFADIV